MVSREELFEVPQSQCPSCGEWVEDYDGFGVLAHTECGYCSHLARTGDESSDECGICDQVVLGGQVVVSELTLNVRVTERGIRRVATDLEVSREEALERITAMLAACIDGYELGVDNAGDVGLFDPHDGWSVDVAVDVEVDL